MITIHKFTLEICGLQTVAIGGFFMEALSTQMQRRELCVWAVVDTGRPREQRKFAVLGTGSDCSAVLGQKYVGTVQDADGFVWHVIDLGIA